jgi:hypothetical protein
MYRARGPWLPKTVSIIRLTTVAAKVSSLAMPLLHVDLFDPEPSNSCSHDGLVRKRQSLPTAEVLGIITVISISLLFHCPTIADAIGVLHGGP